MQKWNCDLCGKDTFINPPTQTVMEEREFTIDVPQVDKDGKLKEPKKITQKAVLPKVAKAKRQNHETGNIEEYDVPLVKDLKPRAYIVQMHVGYENITRDFCKDCLKNIPEIQALWDVLAKIERK